MTNLHSNYKAYLLSFFLLLAVIFSPTFIYGYYGDGSGVGRGGCDFFPNDIEICPGGGSGAPLPPQPQPVYASDNPSAVALNGDFSVKKDETFAVGWSVDWNTTEMEGGRNKYRLSLYQDGDLIYQDIADTEYGQQAPSSGAFEIAGGIDKNTSFTIEAQIESITSGIDYIATDSLYVTAEPIIVIERCNIVTPFVANPGKVNPGSSTKLNFTLNRIFSWDIREVGGAVVASGKSSFGSYVTGNLTTSKLYRLTCYNPDNLGNRVADAPVIVGSTPPPGGGGGGGDWCGVKNSNPIGPRIPVPPSYVLLGSDWMGDYSLAPGHVGVPGAVFEFSGTSTPPAGTNFIVANINMDDGGTVYINGTEVYSVSPTCSIKNNEIIVTNMPAGKVSDVLVRSVNSGLYGVGADINFYYYHTGTIGEDRTPSISAPACSNSNYTATISWTPINAGIRIFVDDDLVGGEGFHKLLESGSSGSTNAPERFTQRISGAPQTLVFEPGKTYYSFIQNETTGDRDGSIVSWKVDTCAPAGQANGYLDTNSTGTNNCSNLSGWAWDPDFPNNRTSVHIYKNGIFQTAVEAGDPRDDLPGNTRHGFTYTIPESWKTETNQRINVYAIDLSDPSDGNPDLIYSPAILNCAPIAKPDLTVGSVTPTTSQSNTATTYSATISNIGEVATGSGFKAILQINNPRNGRQPISTSEPINITTLGPNETYTVSSSRDFSTGSYSMRVCADKDSASDTGTIDESNENNNCGGWTTITVGGDIGTCSDGIQNGDETGVDTGGRCGPVCPGPGCTGTCSDGIKNGDETGIDTGGRCGPVCPGPGCIGTCSDGIKNGDETGVDTGGRCGGSFCGNGVRNGSEQCDDGANNGPLPKSCSSSCVINTIWVGSCGNGVINPGEVCDNGVINGACPKTCSSTCSINVCGNSGTCSDGIKNGDETGIDIGGRCGGGIGSCSDGIQNADETSIDYGGRCGGGVGSCSDGVRNSNETDIDYGGRCGNNRSLRVNKTPGGTVRSVDTKITCGGTSNACSYSYPTGTNVAIEARPSSGYWKFNAWTTVPSGLCSNTSSSCSINMSQSITVTPVFGPRVFDYREF